MEVLKVGFNMYYLVTTKTCNHIEVTSLDVTDVWNESWAL